MRANFSWQRLIGSGCLMLTLCLAGGHWSLAEDVVTTELVVDAQAVDATNPSNPATPPVTEAPVTEAPIECPAENVPCPQCTFCPKCKVGEAVAAAVVSDLLVDSAASAPAEASSPASTATTDGPPGTCRTVDEAAEVPSVNALIPAISSVVELSNVAVLQENPTSAPPAVEAQYLITTQPEQEQTVLWLNRLQGQDVDTTRRIPVSAAAERSAGGGPATLSPQQVTLRLRGLYYMALAENRAADAEALAAALRAMGVVNVVEAPAKTSPAQITPPPPPMLGGGRVRLHTLPTPRSNTYVGKTSMQSIISRTDLMRLRPYPNLKLRVTVMGQTQGAVWGTGIYTDDSDLGTAAVHAGLVQPGQTAELVISVLGPQDSYKGSTSHGVATADFATWQGSFQFETGDHPDAAYYFSDEPVSYRGRVPYQIGMNTLAVARVSAALRQLPEGVRVATWVRGSKQGGWVWGRDHYTADSSLAAAAVHAGVLKDGEVGLLLVETYPGLNSYTASEQNGVTTSSWGAYPRSFRFVSSAQPVTSELAIP